MFYSCVCSDFWGSVVLAAIVGHQVKDLHLYKDTFSKGGLFSESVLAMCC